ncbi:MAG: amidohydrolase family protein [Candidatus Binataceae bacterium]
MASIVVSADSHVLEPADLWTTRLDNRFRDRAPQVVKHPSGPGYAFVAPGIRPFPVATGWGLGKSGKELQEQLTKGYEAARPSGWDPAERIKDQEIDGVAAEVLYTTLGMPLFALEDIELQQACFRAFNDWLAEYASHDRKRLHPIALISLEDVAHGAAELRRAVKLGLKGAMVWGEPPAERPYTSTIYDPFWAAAQELEVPVSLHVITEKNQSKDVKLAGGGAISSISMTAIHSIQQTLCSLIFGRVLERFPRLQVVSAENDSGWVAHFIYRLDHFYQKFDTMSEKTALPMKPSEYIRRQVWATFQDDPVGPVTTRLFGEDNFMWASDFPHSDSTWPNSLKVIADDFAGVPEAVKRKIVFENAVRLYRMDLA